MNKEGKVNLFFASILVLGIFIFSMYIIFAAIAWEQPAAGSTFSANFTYNITYLNASDITYPLKANTTIYYNTSSSSAWVAIAQSDFTFSDNSTITAQGSQSFRVNGTIAITGIADSANITLNITLGNATFIAAGVKSTAGITVDDTPPAVDASRLVGVNYTNLTVPSGNIYLNVSVTDNVLGVSDVYFNITNSSGHFFNMTKAAREANTNNYAIPFNISLLLDGNYTIRVYANDSKNNVNSTQTSGDIVKDSYLPVVYPANISYPVSKNNYSGTININVSVIDMIKGKFQDNGTVSNVFFSLANDSETNNTYIATREGSTIYWSAAINTALLADNNYTIYVYANDTAKNTNNSAFVRFTADNTAPALSSFACSPTSIYTGDSVTCTCSGADPLSGVNATTVTTPTTSATGTHTETCTLRDNAGNSASYTTTFIVEQNGGGGSSGSGSGGTGSGSSGTTDTVISWISAGSITATQLESSAGAAKSLAAERKVSVTINAESYEVGVSEVTATTATVALIGTSGITTDTIAVGEVAKFDVDGDGYYDISATLGGISSDSKAELVFKKISEEVPASELEGQEEEAGVSAGISIWWYIGGAIAIVGIVAIALALRKKR